MLLSRMLKLEIHVWYKYEPLKDTIQIPIWFQNPSRFEVVTIGEYLNDK